MNIKIASEKTGLTKRAIKYYEDEGLITPTKNGENNYREYSEQDIIKLNLIGALRAVDIPILEIKRVIDGDKSIPKVMKDALDKINKDIEGLEKSRLIISNIIEKNLNDYDAASEQIKKLRETLEFSIDEKREFISKTLLRMFPGKYGQFFASTYEPFLNITIDSEEKRIAWFGLVEVLDKFDEVKDSDEVLELMTAYDNFAITEENDQQQKKYERAINNINGWNDSTISNFAEKFIEDIEKISEEEREKLKEMHLIVKKDMDAVGKIRGEFQKYLSILNEDYKKYKDNLLKYTIESKNKFRKEKGIDMDTWISKNILDSKK